MRIYGLTTTNMALNTRRTLTAILGWAVLLLGLVMVPYPGPGWLVVFAGLAILARQFAWARRTLSYARGNYDSWQRWMKRQPLYIKSLFWLLTCATAIITIWLLNGYGLMNDWLNLGLDWLESPFMR